MDSKRGNRAFSVLMYYCCNIPAAKGVGVNPTNNGTWGSFEFCPEGQFVYAYDVKSEPDQGEGDDTGVNSVRMYCMDRPATSESGSLKNPITSLQGWGTWSDVTYCPGANNPMIGYR